MSWKRSDRALSIFLTHTLSKYFSNSLQRSVSRGTVVSSSMAFKRKGCGIAPGTATCLMGTQNTPRGRGQREWGRGSRDLPQVRKLACRVWRDLGFQISRILFPKWHLKFLRDEKRWRKKMPGKCLHVVCKVDREREDVAGQTRS